MHPPSVQGEALFRGYGDGAARTTVLSGLSIRFWPGQLTLLMGASGSGKSTLLALLGGLLRPDAGSVTLLGAPIWSLGERALERFRFDHCGYIFQGFNLFSALTALEQVALPLRFGDVPPAVARRRAQDALDEVGLSARMRLRPGQLSGGEKQRVAIARALVREPKLLFADEPTSALDSANGDIVIGLLQRIAATHGTTVIAVSHDARLVQHADRVLDMRDGTIIDDSADEIAVARPLVDAPRAFEALGRRGR